MPTDRPITAIDPHHPMNAITRDGLGGPWICATCSVRLVVDPTSDPGELSSSPKFIGAAEMRTCREPLGRRAWWYLVGWWWWPLTMLAAQGPGILGNRIMWTIFGAEWSSGCPICDGTGRSTAIAVIDPNGSSEPEEGPCSRCNRLQG